MLVVSAAMVAVLQFEKTVVVTARVLRLMAVFEKGRVAMTL